jgi:hypothetical protein
VAVSDVPIVLGLSRALLSVPHASDMPQGAEANWRASCPREGPPGVAVSRRSLPSPIRGRTGPTLTEERLAEPRVHKRAEVARMLNSPITRLETWVREDRVLHLCAGVLPGVDFTARTSGRSARCRPS